MKISLNTTKLAFIFALSNSLAYAAHPLVTAPITINGPVEARAAQENKIPNYFGIAFYKPTYILPFYLTGSPDNVAYQNTTPNNERLKPVEFKFQISLKVPVWKDIANHPSSLYFAYTQQSYWQSYNRRNFIRESDYEPEVFLENKVNWNLINCWNLNFLNVGVNHQSNGFGTSLQRGWNRLYIDAITSTDRWMISLRPWYILSENNNNENIAKYLGYGRLLVAYKYHDQVFSLQTHNIIEGWARRATAEVTWSFPVTHYIEGYVQVFSGYGQSLIEYNHRTNSGGIGVSFNDWV